MLVPEQPEHKFRVVVCNQSNVKLSATVLIMATAVPLSLHRAYSWAP